MALKRVAIALAILFTTAVADAQSQAYLVADLNQTTLPSGSNPDDFLTLGSLAVFITNDSSGNPLEVWRSDGSAEVRIHSALAGGR